MLTTITGSSAKERGLARPDVTLDLGFRLTRRLEGAPKR